MLQSFSLKHLAFCLLLALNSSGFAGSEQPVPPAAKETVHGSLFTRGARELQLSAAGHFSMNNRGVKRPELNDLTASLRLGVMLDDPSGSGFLRGNFEFLGEVFGGSIFEGPGDGLVGANILLRYNFLAAERRGLIPYFQCGGGGVYTNAAEEPNQRIIGSDLSFNLTASIGVRVLVSEKWAAFVETGYRHISNGDTADRNLGLNSIGGSLGVSYFFH